MSDDLAISALTEEYVWVGLSADPNPMGMPIAVAMTEGSPLLSDFHDAEWVPAEANPSKGQYIARWMIGSDDFPLVGGHRYDVHVKIHSGAQSPVMFAGRVFAT